jgi:hypothetical protein
MTIQEELNELFEIKAQIESPTFQKYICKPLREKQDKLKVSFFSDSLKDSWRKGGKYEGIEEFFEILKQINCDIENKRDEIEQSAS